MLLSKVGKHGKVLIIKGIRTIIASSVSEASRETGVSEFRIVGLIESGDQYKGYCFDYALK